MAVIETVPALWLIMTAGGALVLGAAIAYGMRSTQRRRQDPAAQARTDRATRDLYKREEAKRAREDDDAAPPPQVP